MLVDRGIHEKGQQDRRRSVDGHAHGSLRIAEVETTVEFLGIIHGGNANTTVTYFTINIRAMVGIFSIQRYTVECRTEALGRLAQAHIVKTFVGTLRSAFAGEHACGVFAFPLQRKHAACIRELTGYIFLQLPFEYITPILVFG